MAVTGRRGRLGKKSGRDEFLSGLRAATGTLVALRAVFMTQNTAIPSHQPWFAARPTATPSHGAFCVGPDRVRCDLGFVNDGGRHCLASRLPGLRPLNHHGPEPIRVAEGGYRDQREAA